MLVGSNKRIVQRPGHQPGAFHPFFGTGHLATSSKIPDTPESLLFHFVLIKELIQVCWPGAPLFNQRLGYTALIPGIAILGSELRNQFFVLYSALDLSFSFR
jgi:hypothetical protein